MDVQEHDINYSSPEFLSTASWRYTDILLHHPTSSHIPQKHAVHICKTVQYTVVTCSLVLDDYGNLKGSQLKALLTGLEAPPNSLNPIWKATFCMTGWSHAFPSPNATLQKVPQLIKKTQNLTVWFHPSTCHSGASLGLESHLDRLNRFATAIVWGFRKSLKPNSPGETSIPCFGDPLSTGWHDSLKKGNFQFLLFTKVKLQGSKNDI